MRTKYGTAAVLLAAAALPGASARDSLRGFSSDRVAAERNIERRLLALPQPAECGELLRRLTREPHVAGTPGNDREARSIAEEFGKAGLDVSTESYDVLLSYPQSAELSIVGEPDVRLGRGEEPIASDPDSSSPFASLPWVAYAPSGDVESDVVYVNHGSAGDYAKLAAMNISVKGKIVLARYFGGYRGGKSLEAERQGAAALLVFSDPVDDGWFKGDVYPKGPWGPPSHFQRGSDVYDFLVPGDPLTPGWASTPGARRIPEAESRILPRIPMMPLSSRDAAEILKRLSGPPVPDGWQGASTGDTYHVGPGSVRVRLKLRNTRERRSITDVFGTLRGSQEPEKTILLSNHHDAWGYGAVDPCSGTATMIALARALGTLSRQGWKPRRSIVFGSWDAEEYTLTGSTEWGEEHETDLRRNAIVCLNVDSSTSGRDFSASASPLLFAAIREAAADVADPGAPGRSIADTWREAAGKTNVRSYAKGQTREDLPIAVLGSGSDYTVFFNRLGIASTDLIFDGPYGVYHSIYDSYTWMSTVGDPGFLYHAAMARYVGLLALRFANADVPPFDASSYGREIARYAGELGESPPGQPVREDLAALARTALAWSEQSAEREKAIAARLATGGESEAARSRDEGWMMSLERSMLADEGLPGRPWFRHLVYAPLPSYEAETLPAIREALEAGNAASARSQIVRLAGLLDAAIARARADAR